jgi:1-acyl-sn-glycerol-3-phosphate acyltransferase
MESEGLRQRSTGQHEEREQDTGHRMPADEHPAGPAKHGKWVEALRALLLGLYFLLGAVAIHASQIIGSPLYFFNKDYYYSWMSMTKQNFGVLSTTLNQFWAPVTFRISGDKSVKGQIRMTENGMLECDFPERLVLIANHQIYTDWMYLWWIAYANRMHGHIYIILKESLKWIPILGTGMMFFSFIFLSRKWETDKARFTHRLRKLNRKHHSPMSGSIDLDPMWLLIFPEGTNLAKNGRAKSQEWSHKSGIPDLQHALLPRKTGLLFCLEELKDTVQWVYDCTIAYEGVP